MTTEQSKQTEQLEQTEQIKQPEPSEPLKQSEQQTPPQQTQLPPEQIKQIRAALLNQIKITQDNVLKLKMKLARLTYYCKHDGQFTEKQSSESDGQVYKICNICGGEI